MSEKYRGFYDITEDIIRRLKSAGCKVVSFGDTPDYANEKNTVTPGAHVSPIGFSNNDTTNTVQLEIFCYDLVTLYKLADQLSQEPQYGENNNIDALDTCMSILDRFVKQILSRTIQLDTGGYYRVNGGPQWNAVYEEGNTRVTGWIGTLSITMQNYTSSCP